ncbi:ornithine carbamoyltransferase precursor-like protein [Annulohypoxylon maeteangense]|uniref:ornithine carbamoyltransferase precursor-like protein n=1 Tax=Annulohypoxylon maeteangense TaxID=1927788 RepID=UPI002008B617|nr:ornithine carbamoyltransferase precursor-like protein [Annulohypoxylon maeteangense]KAI0884720.1 ornithine carbamoyltransferase precursor-like protein [Annulohypoxylon maeteangense]
MRSPALRLAQRTSRYVQARSYSATPKPVRHLMSISDLTRDEFLSLVSRAAAHKGAVKSSGIPQELNQKLTGQTVAMMFSKLSTRTRVSTEAAVTMLGGHPMFLGKNDIQLGVNESLLDTSKVISSMTSSIVARVGPHSDITGLAEHSSVPVINALSNDFHPLQIIADFLTIYESTRTSKDLSHPDGLFGKIVPNGLKIAWVGDANNVLFDFATACVKTGIEISVATPRGYGIPKDMVNLITSQADSTNTPGILNQTFVPEEAVKDADFIVTDTWISMGQEEETQKRLKDFAGFQVTNDLAKRGGAKADWKFMHCLPRHHEEVEDKVFYSDRSLVFPEAENRLWAAVAALEGFVVNKGELLRK